MSGHVSGNLDPVLLRMRAVERLQPAVGAASARRGPSDALSVLFDMASDPSTAGSALAVLHELQVHQVELELQDEELRRSRAELEAAVRRLTHLYDDAPVGYCTLDESGVLRELNLTGAAMLEGERDHLQGQSLSALLAPQSASQLQDMIGRLTDGASCESRQLELVVKSGVARSVRVYGKRDSDGVGFLVTFVNTDKPKE